MYGWLLPGQTDGCSGGSSHSPIDESRNNLTSVGESECSKTLKFDEALKRAPSREPSMEKRLRWITRRA